MRTFFLHCSVLLPAFHHFLMRYFACNNNNNASYINEVHGNDSWIALSNKKICLFIALNMAKRKNFQTGSSFKRPSAMPFQRANSLFIMCMCSKALKNVHICRRIRVNTQNGNLLSLEPHFQMAKGKNLFPYSRRRRHYICRKSAQKIPTIIQSHLIQRNLCTNRSIPRQ